MSEDRDVDIVSISIAIVSAFVAVASMAFSVISYRKTVIHDRKQATLDAYNRLQTEVFDNLNTYKPCEIQDIVEDPKAKDYKVISGYLARIEHFCVGINEKIYDEDTFYALAHGYFDGNQLKNRIEPLLEAKNKSNTTNELFYKNIYTVLQKMDNKSKER